MERSVYSLKAGNIKNLKQSKEKLSAPAEDSVTVAVKAIGLNFADLFAIWGLYKATPKGVFIPGLEYAGEVVAVGKKVDKVKIGDRVMGVTRFGAYATHVNIEQDYIQRLPDDWTYEEGAAFPVQALTAYYALVNLGELQEGQTVLIHSAAGGVGTLANRMAKKLGARTIGTVGNESKVAHCKQEGYDEVIVRGKDFVDKLPAAIGDGKLNLVLECIGGKIREVSYANLAPQGRMVVYGSARFAGKGDKPNMLRVIYQFLTRPKLDLADITHTNRGVLGFNLIYLYEQKETMDILLGEINKLNIGKPYIGHTFPFDDLPNAIREIRDGNTRGKVVIQV